MWVNGTKKLEERSFFCIGKDQHGCFVMLGETDDLYSVFNEQPGCKR